MALLIAATFAAAFAGAFCGTCAGLVFGTQSMIAAVKKAFGPDDAK